MNTRHLPRIGVASALFALALAWGEFGLCLSGFARQTFAAEKPSAAAETAAADAETFRRDIEPLLTKYCRRCHQADNMKSGVRVDQLTAVPEDQHIATWKGALHQLQDEAMPPEDEPQPTEAERARLVQWIERLLIVAKTRQRQKNGVVRRLTVAQYRNTLRDLLGLDEDLTDSLPPDAVSKEGFTNHDKTLLLSPLQVETYFEIASQALDRCVVDPASKPVVQNFRVDFGQGINPEPCPDKLILGANSHLLENNEFIVHELAPARPFPYTPFAMQRKFEFIEGYQGNDTVRGWRKFDSIYHAVFACLRGTPGYPKGEAHQVIRDGLLLRPAIPSPEIFGNSNTYGPMANFKISLRELPNHGTFRVTVRAAKYNDGLLLDPNAPLGRSADAIQVGLAGGAPSVEATLTTDGIYQIDVELAPGKPTGLARLELAGRQFTGQLYERPRVAEVAKPDDATAEKAAAFLVVRLPAGKHPVQIRYGDNSRLQRLTFNPLPPDSQLARQFAAFERRQPSVGVHVGLRRDCGSTLAPVGPPQSVAGGELRDYVFQGAINDFPSPDVEPNNVNYLAGVREIGVRSEYTDGREMPRLLVRSVEFEGPYYTSWPPASHRAIFIDFARPDDHPAYAREILRSFATRAYRRPVTDAELASLVAIWKSSYDDHRDFQRSVKEALTVVLTSPQFLFLIENSQGPQAEDLDSYELASKLSYFLWNTAPDARLLELAAQQSLAKHLDAEIDRLVRDPRFEQFTREFVSQWLSLDKFDVVSVDMARFPQLTRDAKSQLRLEPIRYVEHLLRQNASVKQLIASDLVVANEVVASYYGFGDKVESGFQFVPLQPGMTQLGGVLSQAAILSGLSDGREPNPVKRGAWVARKIIAEPPDDPPPNVPQIKADDGTKLTLREKLEQHRNQPGCAKCHSGIDPWGLPFERFDAAGLLRRDSSADSRSKLPDGAEVANLDELKAYFIGPRIDQIAFSYLKHLATYAVGRSLTYNELVFLQEEAVKFRADDYRMLDLLKFVVRSDLFLKK